MKISAALLALALLSSSTVAFADDEWPVGDTIVFGANQTGTSYPLIHENGMAFAVPSTTTTGAGAHSALATYFNLAHCECSAAGEGGEQTFAESVKMEGPVAPTASIPSQFWFGTSCNLEATRAETCEPAPSSTFIGDITSTYNNAAALPEFPISDLLFVPGQATTCPQEVISGTLWILTDSTQDGTYQGYSATTTITADTQPPALPTSFTASGGEGAIQLDWQNSPERPNDTYYFQVLCSQSGGPNDGMPAFATPPVAPRYQTARTLCDLGDDISISPVSVQQSFSPDAAVDARVDAGPLGTDAGPVIIADAGIVTTPDAGVVPGIPTALAQLNSAYLCGEVQGPSATSLRIEGLTDGVQYNVLFLVVDGSGNAAGAYFTTPIEPVSTVDFWEDLHDQGSTAEGGFCLLAETYGDDSGISNALRDFRDDELGSSTFGRWFTTAYYADIAPLGQYVHDSIVLRVLSSIVLAPLVAIALMWHLLTLPGMLLVIAFTFWFGSWGRRKISQRRFARMAATLGNSSEVEAS